MLDVVNESLIKKGEDPIAFDSDCREGICGSLRPGHRRHRSRARQGRDDLPGAHAPLQELAKRSRSSRFAPGLPHRQGPRSSIGRPSIASLPPAAYVSMNVRWRP
jgi:hypothetical protein